MPVLFKSDIRLAFVHVPRTGGTFVETLLRQIGTLRFCNNGIRESMKVTPQHLTMDDLKYLFGQNFFNHSFMYVREPLARIKSAYAIRRMQNSGAGFSMPEFETWVVDQFNGFHRNSAVSDNHIRPQSHFIGDTTELFRFEDGMDGAVTYLEELFEVSLETPATRPLQSDSESVTCSKATEAVIRDFYRIDYETFSY